jgi:DNA helicase-2/ATP-dependent DNA helicase PcrA
LARGSRQLPLALLIEHMLGLAESEHLRSAFRDYYLIGQPTSASYLETLSAIDLLRNLTNEFAETQTTLADFVRYIDLNLSTQRVVADESWFMSDERAVQLLTVYKAKGLEFDQVFVVDATESMWSPRTGGRASPANLQLQAYGEKYDDYIRLLYVAATRAKRAFVATSYFTDERGNEILPTPLLAALPLTRVEQPVEEPIEVLETGLRWPSLESHDERALLKDRLEQFSLSSTALIDFLNLAEAGPLSFKQRHLLRLPTPRSAVGSYGTAVHAALETAQRLVNTTQLTVETVLDRFESALEAEHLAPIDFKRFQKRGEDLLPPLLADNSIGLQKGGLAEQRISDIIVGTAKINGKLDRIDRTDEGLLISDYKTGKALHSLDTKDRAKAVKAWRHQTQLLFYSLLVQHDNRFKPKSGLRAQMLYVEAEEAKRVALCYTPTADELERLTRLIQAIWQHVQALDFPNVSKYPADIDGIKRFEADLIDGNL